MGSARIGGRRWARAAVGLFALALTALPSPAGADTLPTFVKNLAGPGLAAMYPVDVTVSDTRYYVLDAGRYRVVAIARSTGAIVAQVGGKQGRAAGLLGAARAIASDSAGNIYVADTPNNRIQKFDGNLNFIKAWGTKGNTDGKFTQVYGVAVGMGKGAGGADAEVLYAADNTGRIQKFDLNGNHLSTFSTTVNKPRQMAVHPSNNNVYVISAADKNVVVYNQSGSRLFSFGGPGSGTGQFKRDPRGISIAANGRVFVTDPGNYRIQMFASNGTYLDHFGSQGSNPWQFVDPRGVVVTSEGQILVTDQWNFALKEYTDDAGGGSGDFPFIRKLFGAGPPVGGFNTPRGMDVDGSGRPYITDWWNQRIQRFNADGTGALAFGYRGIRTQLGALNFAWDVAIQPGTGRVFVANRESHEIEVFEANGAPVTGWGKQGVADGMFKFPQGVAFAPGGDLLVTDSANHRVQRFSIGGNGVGTWKASYGSKGTSAGQFNTPAGISVASDGTIWVADTLNNRIQRRNPSTGGWTSFAAPSGGTSFKLPWGVTVNPDDGTVWVADSANKRVVKMTSAGSLLLAFTGQQVGAGEIDRPFDVAFGPGGRIWISDTWNNRIVELAA